MGLAPTFWMRSIDTFGTATADKPALLNPGHFKHIETETYGAETNPCARILQKVGQHIPDVNYDKMHHRGICNDNGTLVDPAWYYSSQYSAPDSAKPAAFLDPALGAAATGKPAPQTNKGARY